MQLSSIRAVAWLTLLSHATQKCFCFDKQTLTGPQTVLQLFTDKDDSCKHAATSSNQTLKNGCNNLPSGVYCFFIAELGHDCTVATYNSKDCPDREDGIVGLIDNCSFYSLDPDLATGSVKLSNCASSDADTTSQSSKPSTPSTSIRPAGSGSTSTSASNADQTSPHATSSSGGGGGGLSEAASIGTIIGAVTGVLGIAFTIGGFLWKKRKRARRLSSSLATSRGFELVR